LSSEILHTNQVQAACPRVPLTQCGASFCGGTMPTATYDPVNFLGVVQVASIMILLKQF
jgi:hypothetical protein